MAKVSTECPVNNCGRPLGSGTNITVRNSDGATRTEKVCEEHWQALRWILPLPRNERTRT